MLYAIYTLYITVTGPLSGVAAPVRIHHIPLAEPVFGRLSRVTYTTTYMCIIYTLFKHRFRAPATEFVGVAGGYCTVTAYSVGRGGTQGMYICMHIIYAHVYEYILCYVYMCTYIVCD